MSNLLTGYPSRVITVSFGLLLFTLTSLTPLLAQITPSGDAYTNTALPTTNFGDKPLLDVQSSTQIAYIQFDLLSLPAGYTSANLAKATLKLYVNAAPSAGSFNVDFVNGTWTEKTITAGLSPALGTTIAASVPLGSANVHDYILIDITAAVGAWLDGTQANDGLALVANSPLNATFDSKENATQSHPPELDIVFRGGTITGVTTATGSGLAGGGTSGTLNLALVNTCVTKQILQWNGNAWVCAAAGTGTITGVTAGTDLTGGGTSGSVTLSVDTTKVPQLATANTFTGNQTVNGSLSATGVVTGSGYQIGSNLFAFGSYDFGNAFLGFAGNSTMTGEGNTASGWRALFANTTGVDNVATGSNALGKNTEGDANTASGFSALYSNTTGHHNTGVGYDVLTFSITGSYNTAIGGQALVWNNDGSNNTASGWRALYFNSSGSFNTATGYFAGLPDGSTYLTGNNDTAVGANSKFGTGSLSNATAIGANAEVTQSNALVLGSINGVNGATADTNVGIGTTAPTYKLHVGSGNNGFRVEGPPQGTGSPLMASFGGSGDFAIDKVGAYGGRFLVKDNGMVGIGTNSPDNTLSVLGSADKTGGGSWGTYSDGRLKTLHGSFNAGLSQILQLHPVRYRYKEENGMGIHDPEEHIGFVAQEVQRVIPEAVIENNKGYLLVNNDPILWTMLNAIKEQQREIASLRAQLRQRAAKEARLESRLAQLEQGREEPAKSVSAVLSRPTEQSLERK